MSSIQNNYFDRTFEEGKIFTSNHEKDEIKENDGSIFKNQEKYEEHLHETSYEKILPFVHIQETKELIKIKKSKDKQSRRKNRKDKPQKEKN